MGTGSALVTYSGGVNGSQLERPHHTPARPGLDARAAVSESQGAAPKPGENGTMPSVRDITDWDEVATRLKRRRVELDPRYRNRTTFSAERNINLKLAQDIENCDRRNFDETTLTIIEMAYAWAPGSIVAVGTGGEPTAADPRKLRIMQAIPDLLRRPPAEEAGGENGS
jgi:hypothetical protein